MAEFTIVKGGQEYVVRNVNNEQEAVDKFKRMVGGQTTQPQSEGPSFASFLPFGATSERLAQGQGFGYGEGPEGASRLFGDLATGAGAIAAGGGAGASGAPLLPVLGAGLAGAGLAAGVGYGAEKLGITPGLHRAAESIREATLPKALTAPEHGGDWGVEKNFLLQLLGQATPQGQIASMTEALPMAAQFAAGAGGAKLSSMAVGKAGQMAAKSAMPSQAEIDLAKYGGEPTPAASGGRLAKTMEFSARSNPLLQMLGKYKGVDEANIQAAQKFAESKFGPDIRQGVRPAIGETMRGLLDELAGRRSAKYAPAVEALEKAKGFPNYSKSLLQSVEKVAKDANVTESVRKAFMNAANEALKGKNTPLRVDKALTDIRLKFSEKFKTSDKKVLDQIDRDFNVLAGGLKRANYDALNRVQPGLGDEIAAAKGEYAGASKVISPLNEIMRARGQKPEAIMGDILNRGTEGVKAMMNELTPSEKAAFQGEFARFILEESKGSQGPSAAKIKSLLAGRYKDIAPLVGGKGIANLQRLAGMMEAAKFGDLYTQNPSGSAVTGAGLLQGGLAVPFWKAMLAKTAIDAPYAYAGMPIVKGLRTAKAGLAKMTGQTPVNLPPDLLRALSVMSAAPGAIAR